MKMNKKGFTLIELLAVITIMGILLLVAIPAVSRTIENSRRDTFMNTAKSYINAVKNAVAADELYLGDDPISALPDGYYYYGFDSNDNSGTDLMEQGGRSSWGNAHVTGYVAIHKTVAATTVNSETTYRTKYEYAITMVDVAKRGITDLTTEESLRRSSVKTTSSVDGRTEPPTADKDTDKFGTTNMIKQVTSGTPPTTTGNCAALTIG